MFYAVFANLLSHHLGSKCSIQQPVLKYLQSVSQDTSNLKSFHSRQWRTFCSALKCPVSHVLLYKSHVTIKLQSGQANMFAKEGPCLLQSLESVTRHQVSHPSSPDKHRICALNFGYKKWLAFAKPNITMSSYDYYHVSGQK